MRERDREREKLIWSYFKDSWTETKYRVICFFYCKKEAITICICMLILAKRSTERINHKLMKMSGDRKEKRPHFVKGKGSPKPHALGQSAAHPRSVSS